MKHWALGFVALIGLQACAAKVDEKMVVLVNGEPISERALDLERRLAGPEKTTDDDLIESLIDQTLILQEGRRLGVALNQDALESAEKQTRDQVHDEVFNQSLAERGVSLKEWRGRLAQAALADAVVKQAIRNTVDIGHQEIQDYYWEHLTAFRHGDRKVLRQIFTKTRIEGEAALREIGRGKPFADVAARLGQGPEAAQGGLLGPVSRAQLPKPLALALQKLKPQQVSPLVKSPWGWHLLYVDALDLAEGQSLDQAAPKAQARLVREKEQVLFQLWLSRLREQAKIERFVNLLTPTVPAKTGPL